MLKDAGAVLRIGFPATFLHLSNPNHHVFHSINRRAEHRNRYRWDHVPVDLASTRARQKDGIEN
jgi:hypothetical protein